METTNAASSGFAESKSAMTCGMPGAKMEEANGLLDGKLAEGQCYAEDLAV